MSKYCKHPTPIFAVGFIITLSVYILITFALTTSNRFFVYPWHPDDYGFLARTVPIQVRPISALLVDALSFSGERGTYLYIDFITVVDTYLAFIFVSLFLNTRATIKRFALFSLLAFSLPAYIATDKNIGTVTNLTSAFFGLVAMLAVWACFERDRRWLIISVVCYALSIFSKEDYAATVPSLVIFYVLCNYRHRAMRSRSLTLAGAMASVALLYELYHQVLFPTPFVDASYGASEPYYIDISPQSIAHVFVRYFHLTFPITSFVAFIVAGLVYAVTVDRRLRIYLLLLLIGTLFAPFLVLPNHVYSIYCVNWIPWIIAGIANLEAPIRLRRLIPQTNRWRARFPRAFQGVLPFALTFLLVVQTQGARANYVHYYLGVSEYNHRLMNAILRNKDDINRAGVVGVKGLKNINPFMTRDSFEYLKGRGLHGRWVVFLEPDDPLASSYRDVPLQRNTATNWRDSPNDLMYANLAEIGQFAGLLLLEFAPSGELANQIIIDTTLYPKRLEFPASNAAMSANQQRAILSGIYPDEGNPWRWTSKRATFMLHATADTRRLNITFYLPDNARFEAEPRTVAISFAGGMPQNKCCFGTGKHEVSFDLAAGLAGYQNDIPIVVTIDPTFTPASIGMGADIRELGIILLSAGFD